MLSRVAFGNGASLVAVLRNSNKLQPLVLSSFHTNTKDIATTQQLIDRWDECNKKYYGPERDHANFPHPTQPETHEPVRLGFIPKSWFDALYEKTGVSGPYVFLGGLATFCMSKEIMVYDHSFFDLAAFWGAFIFLTKKIGPAAKKFLEDKTDKQNELNYEVPMDTSRQAFSEAVGKIDTEIAQEDRHKFMYAVQKENVDIQLEARYRERVAQVYSAVKRRLDYQVELVSTKKRLEQQHMVNWIVDSVVSGITPKQEKDAITSCIGNLRALAKAQPAV